MAQTKRELVTAALDQAVVDRVPVGFWHHFLPNQRKAVALGNRDIVAKNLAGLAQFYQAFQPDFLKLMSDGYFLYPNEALKNLSGELPLDIRPLGPEHPWIEEQVKLVKSAVQEYGQEVLEFYNIFSPVRYLEFLQDNEDVKSVIAAFLVKDKAALKRILAVIAEDVATLSKRVITEGGADGIYLSVQNNPDPTVTKELYEEVIAPYEQFVLAAANRVSKYNILHICGYQGCRNDLTWYQNYDVKAVNYAAVVERIPLSAAKAIFSGKAIIGGFDNTVDGVLYQGDKKAIAAETKALIAEVGTTGVILGADCTVPNDIAVEHLQWVREAAAAL